MFNHLIFLFNLIYFIDICFYNCFAPNNTTHYSVRQSLSFTNYVGIT